MDTSLHIVLYIHTLLSLLVTAGQHAVSADYFIGFDWLVMDTSLHIVLYIHTLHSLLVTAGQHAVSGDYFIGLTGW